MTAAERQIQEGLAAAMAFDQMLYTALKPSRAPVSRARATRDISMAEFAANLRAEAGLSKNVWSAATLTAVMSLWVDLGFNRCFELWTGQNKDGGEATRFTPAEVNLLSQALEINRERLLESRALLRSAFADRAAALGLSASHESVFEFVQELLLARAEVSRG